MVETLIEILQVKVPAPEGKLKVVLPQLEIPANKTQVRICCMF